MSVSTVKKGDYDSALQAASAEGHEKVVELLLDKGANIDA
jgi:ankyrin repeat protein